MSSTSPGVDWGLVRAEFPAASRYTYLNTAGAPPLSRRAAGEARRYYDEMQADGDLPWPRWLEQVEGVRVRVARILAADPSEIAFTYSASHAFSLLASLLGPPAHVVTMDDEFPSATLPWLQHGDRLTFVPSRAHGDVPLDDVAAAIEPATRAVVTSSVMYRTGFRHDLRALGELCRRRGVRLVVDASQSMSVVDIDVKRDGIDALAFSGYKWTLAGYGIGALYVSRELLRRSKLPTAGWWSARDPEAVIHDRLELKDTAAALEVGSPHFAGIFALGGSLELLEEIGYETVAARVHELTDYLHRRLDEEGLDIASPRAREKRAGITIVRVDDAARVVERLASAGIIVSARGAGIRIAPHVFNLESDIDRAVAALAAIRRGESVSPEALAPRSRVICVDLNGVLDRFEGWKGDSHWDPPAPGAHEFLRTLREHDWRIVVFTARHYLGAQRWLAEHDLLKYVNEITDVKPAADVFVDDRAVCHRGDLRATLEQVLAFNAHWEQA
jgi:cysteine desulfurase / selenocysteine lyase